jgi:hypothetical protein
MKALIKIAMCLSATLFLSSCYEKVPEPKKATVNEIKIQSEIPAVSEVVFKPITEEMKTISGGGCNFDLIAGQPRDLASIDVQKASTALLFTGWAVVSMDDENVGKKVWLKLAGANNYLIQTDRVERQDVAEYFKKKGLAKSGFQVTSSVSNVDAGKYTLSILIEGDSSVYDCGVMKSLNIL